MKKIITCLALLSVTAIADVPSQSVTVDFEAQYAPNLSVYRANAKTFAVTVKNAASVYNLTGYTPVMWWATNSTASTVVTGVCTIVTATNGTFTAAFGATDINYTPGRYVYGVGIVSNGVVRTARVGVLTIEGDPFASGAGPVTWTTNVNISIFNWMGKFPTSAIPDTVWSVWRAGTHGSGSNGWYAVDGTNTFWILHP